MKYVKFLFIGILFGITLSKSEVISWYRIYEMFQFQAFHMYGVIGSAVVLGALIIFLIKRKKMKSYDGEEIIIPPKDKSFTRYIVGGIIFGMGWALSGACPGPLFILLGHGILPIMVVIAGALLGALAYGMLKNRLPH